MRLILFSPHMDDAALDAGDHILKWKALGWDVSIVSVFTGFGSSAVNQEVRRAVGMNGLTNFQFEKIRKQEDARAMRGLGVHYEHLDLTDAAFRGVPFRSVFSGDIFPADNMIVRRLSGMMKKHKYADKIIVPLGIGGHIDHVIVRRSAEATVPPDRVAYYIDYPYALKLSNWHFNHLHPFSRWRISVLPMSKRKWRACEEYASQIPVLFPRPAHYWECMINV